MLKNMTLGQYYPGDSAIHILDPRVKIVLTIAYIAAVFMVGGVIGYVLIALFVLFCTKVSRIRIKYLLRGLKPLLFIILFTAVLNLFLMGDGDVIWQWGFLKLTVGGVSSAFYFAFRLIILVLGTSLLTLTTSPIALTDGLERLLSPLRVVRFPVHELSMMMTIALRFIPTLMEETDKIMKAQMARGADFETGNLMRRAKAMIPLLVPLFVGAFRRAMDLAMAMEARCYRGGEGRTHMRVLRIGRVDVIACITMGVLMLCIVLEGRL